MESLAITLLVVLASCQVAYGGYVTGSSYYPYPLGNLYQPTVVQVPQKQPLQLRPPVSSSAPALPNNRPPVVAIHADPRPPPAVTQVTAPQALPVVAIQAAAVPPKKIVIPESAVPSYSFGYAVKDTLTGDEKSHEETRTGDTVVGRYTVVEPDGTLRIVTYTAGANGFNAVVERTPGFAPPNAPTKVVAVTKPIAIASPIAVSKPVAVASPVAISRPVAISPPNFVNPVTYPAGFHFGG